MAVDPNKEKVLREWERQGRPVPPPDYVKQDAVSGYGRDFSLATLIETGTLHGDMVWAMRDAFARIITIELFKPLAEKARQRFARLPHVTVVEDDSTRALPRLLAGVAEPCLFWLDGHYSGAGTGKGAVETPILSELESVLSHPMPGHVVLIDDARLFLGKNDYPTVDELRAFVGARRADWLFNVRDDIIRAHAPRRAEG